MSSEEQIVEHVVLFKVKPDADPSKVAAWVNGLNGLTSLQLTLHLSAGQLLRCRSSSLTFIHMLHSRYRSKEHLRQYGVHPEHVRVVTEGKSIVDDVMALDWMISNAAASTVSPKPGSAMRVGFYKLKKESLGEIEKARVLEAMGGIEELSSVGESFCDDRAKGYTIASIAVFPNGNPPAAADLDLNYSGDLLLLREGAMKDSIQSVVVVDYVIPSPQ